MVFLPHAGPVWGGVIAGILHTALGPDHLCTIATLSAFGGTNAFWFGFRWAFGHASGMTVICVLFSVLQASATHAWLEQYEYLADCAVGVSLVCTGCYFFLRSGDYFDESWVAKRATCACHRHTPGGNDEGTETSIIDLEHVGTQPLMEGSSERPSDARSILAICLGFLQGATCPGGLLGIVFLKQYQPLEMLVFVFVFFSITAFVMGCVAMAYGALTKYASSEKVAQRMYTFSCALSVGCGIVWLGMNLRGGAGAHHHVHNTYHGHYNENRIRLAFMAS
uniref:Nickel/cobalt efflux system n=1 Tax=Noctiluca scintillans TaxID=2966 RepID=A0A7S1A8N2_NOCSC|mmetsp:Transcript_36243/g.96313  ORF Transcript_36243/g.96313 Transcript_36243/m.96313 type:complete len:280 (+) Transcript_36243:67-906(+)